MGSETNNRGVSQVFGPVLVPAKSIPKESWEPIFPDFAPDARSRGLAAWLAPAAFFVAVIAAAAPALSWAGVYPDRVDRRGPHASLQRAFFFDPLPIPAAAVPVDQLGWRGEWPDLLTRAETHASRQDWYFKPETPLPAAPPLSWEPTYPDVLGRRPTHASGAPSVFVGAFAPAIPSADVAAGGARGVQVSRVQIQYQSVTGPVFVPPTGVDAFAWRPVYPSVLERRDVHASRQDWYFKPETPLPAAPALSWQPDYPDVFPPRRTQPTGWYVKPNREPDDIARLGWRGRYPDQLESRRAQPSGWYVRPQNEPPDIAPRGWRPVYPDRAEGPRGLHASLQDAHFFSPFPITAAVPLSWSPIYPDQVRRRAPEVPGWYVRPLNEPPDIARGGWRGEWPDRLDRVAVPEQRATFYTPFVVTAVDAFAWRAVYPDQVRGPVSLHAALQDAWTGDLRPIPTAAMGWRGTWPDVLSRLDRRPWLDSGYFRNPTPLSAAPLLSWHPVYPEWIARGGPHAAYQRPDFRDSFPITVPTGELGWRGEWPDLLNRLEVHASRVPAYFKSPLPQPAAPALSWLGRYADVVWPTRGLHVSLQRAFFFDPFPRTRTDDLGWRGTWPDLLNRLDVHASRQLAYFKSPLPMAAAPALSWRGLYPDQVWPPRALGAALRPAFFFYVEPQANEEKFGWRGEWPDYLSRLETHASRVPAYFKSPLPMQAAPPLAWLGRYADRVDPARALLAAQQRAFFFDPAPLAVPTSQFGWRGSWPDVLFRRERRPWLEAPHYFKSPLPQPAAPLLSWSPSYPLPVRPRLIIPPSAIFVPVVARVETFAWWGEYPDLLFRLERRPWLAPAFFKSPLPLAAAPPLSWGPEYPDRIDPAKALGVALQRALFFYPEPITAEERFAWWGEWPDWIARLERQPWLISGSFKSPLPQPAAPLLSWRGEWPADFARAFTHPSRIPSYFEPTGYGPAQTVPPLAWLPIFPDFARGDTTIRWELFRIDYAPIVTALPCGVEAHNVALTFPYADDVLVLTPIATDIVVTSPDAVQVLVTTTAAGDIIVRIVSASDPTVTPDE